jgi:hypothetical protein
VARTGESKGAYRVLVGKHEEKRPLERPRPKWENDRKINIQEIGRNILD